MACVRATLCKQPEQGGASDTNRKQDKDHEASETEHQLIKPSQGIRR